MDLEKVKSIIEKALSEIGYELYSMKNTRNRDGNILEVVVDRAEPINLDDIMVVSNKLNEVMDKEDPIKEAYTLDISSLGAEKPLKVSDLHKYVGQHINVHINNPIEGINIFEGDIVSVMDNVMVLTYKVKTRTKSVSISLDNILKVRLAIKF